MTFRRVVSCIAFCCVVAWCLAFLSISMSKLSMCVVYIYTYSVTCTMPLVVSSHVTYSCTMTVLGELHVVLL